MESFFWGCFDFKDFHNIDIYLLLSPLSLIAQTSSHPRVCCGLLHVQLELSGLSSPWLAVPGCLWGKAVQEMLFLRCSGCRVADTHCRIQILWGNSRLQLQLKISSGSGTELPQGLAHHTARGKLPPGFGETQALAWQLSLLAGEQERAARPQSIGDPSTHPPIYVADVTGWLLWRRRKMHNLHLVEIKVVKQLKFRTDNCTLLSLKNMGSGNSVCLPLLPVWHHLLSINKPHTELLGVQVY